MSFSQLRVAVEAWATIVGESNDILSSAQIRHISKQSKGLCTQITPHTPRSRSCSCQTGTRREFPEPIAKPGSTRLCGPLTFIVSSMKLNLDLEIALPMGTKLTTFSNNLDTAVGADRVHQLTFVPRGPNFGHFVLLPLGSTSWKRMDEKANRYFPLFAGAHFEPNRGNFGTASANRMQETKRTVFGCRKPSRDEKCGERQRGECGHCQRERGASASTCPPSPLSRACM